MCANSKQNILIIHVWGTTKTQDGSPKGIPKQNGTSAFQQSH